jgi:hypothetical protein
MEMGRMPTLWVEGRREDKRSLPQMEPRWWLRYSVKPLTHTLNGPKLCVLGRREPAGLCTSSLVMEMVGVPLPVLGGIREWRRCPDGSRGLSSELLPSSCTHQVNTQ